MAEKKVAPKAKTSAKKDPKAARVVKLKELVAGDEALLKRLAEQKARAEGRLEKRQAELAEFMKGSEKEAEPDIVFGEVTETKPKGGGKLIVKIGPLELYW